MSCSTQPNNTSRRPLCPQCQRPTVRCLCPFITPVDNLIEVLILQHPLEAGHAKNSAQLLHMSLHNSQLHCGEHWDDALLARWLAPPSAAATDTQHTVLLYPDTPWGDVHPRFEPTLESTPAGPLQRLVILDATWRKSRKMLHLNPRLQRLPRWSLPSGLPVQYQAHGVRKAHQPHQLSTLEACCHALLRLGPVTKTAPTAATPEALLDAFSRWLSTFSAHAALSATPISTAPAVQSPDACAHTQGPRPDRTWP